MKTVFWKAVFSLTLMVGLLFSGVSLVFGVQAPTVAVGPSSGFNGSYTGAGSTVTAQAGNVTELNLSGTQTTTHWAGFFGNVTGRLTLQDASNSVFYNWSGLGTPIGEVYASNTSTVDWTTIGCANDANKTSIDTFLGMTGSSPDSVYNTFTGQVHQAFSVAGTSIGANSCNTTQTYTAGGVAAANFTQILLSSGANIPVYTTLINSTSTSFKGTGTDFQLLTGVNGYPSTGTLYFFIELG